MNEEPDSLHDGTAAQIPHWTDRKQLAPGGTWKQNIREAKRSGSPTSSLSTLSEYMNDSLDQGYERQTNGASYQIFPRVSLPQERDRDVTYSHENNKCVRCKEWGFRRCHHFDSFPGERLLIARSIAELAAANFVKPSLVA